MYNVRRVLLTYTFPSTQHVHSAGRARRNAVGRRLARSVYEEDCPMSATSHICLEVSGQGTNIMLLLEPTDSPGVLVHELQPLLLRRQVVPRYRVHQMFLAACLILI